MKYFWPLLLGAVMQVLWNAVTTAFLGDFDSPFGDWIYARNCNHGFCDGNVALAVLWGLVAVTFIVNTARQLRSRP